MNNATSPESGSVPLRTSNGEPGGLPQPPLGLLHGVRILAVEQYGAGPFGSQFLVGLGAEVIKIESPEDGGDISRSVGPHFMDELPGDASSLFFQSLNVGKKSLSLSLRHPQGRALFHRLCEGAHAVVSNLRGDVPARLGLTYGQLKVHNPALVCAHLTGYGREGERASWPGYDYLMQAEAGYFSLTGEPGSPPARMGLSVIDYMTGVVMALGTVAAIHDAARSGVGCDVDVSLFDVALFNLNYVGAWQLNAAAETTRQPRSAHPSLTPCQLFTTADGWIYLMCNKEKFWRVLCERIGRPELLERPEFISYAQRLAHRELLTQELDRSLVEHTTAHWMAVLGGAVPAAPVRSVAEALHAPQAQESGRIASMPLPGGQSLQLLRSPLRYSKPEPQMRPAPARGADTIALLSELGLDGADIERLREQGAL